MQRWRWLSICLLGSLLCSACSDRPLESCKHPCDDPAYPSGPYGETKGSVVANLPVRVWHDVNRDGMVAADPPGDIHLADYRGRFLAGGPRVLAVVGCAYWCAPCHTMQPALVAWHRQYGDDVVFLEIVFEKNDHSSPDDPAVTDWADRFAIPFDMGREISAGDLHAFGVPFTFPATTMVSLCNMTILSMKQGFVPGIEADIQAALAATDRR